MRMRQRMAYGPLAVMLGLLALTALPARAQGDPMMGAQFSMQMGFFAPTGDSDIWDFNETFTTQDTSDFDDWIIGMSFGVPVARHLDVQFGIQYYDGETDVRYRDIFTISDGAVEQHHDLWFVPHEVTLRFLLIPRRSASGHLYPIVPYIGGGGGGLYWEYREEGLFADDVENPTFVFFDEREERGLTWAAHAVAGLEVQFTREAAMFFEGRYRWAEDGLGGDFEADLDDIDLGGLSLSAGFTWRFGYHYPPPPPGEYQD